MNPSTTSSRNPVKVTYLARTKRKKSTIQQDPLDSSSSSESSPANKKGSPTMRTFTQPATPTSVKNNTAKPRSKAVAPFRTPAGNTKQPPKQIDPRDVPGPAPSTRLRRDSDQSNRSLPQSQNISTPHPKKAISHVRARSSPSIKSSKQKTSASKNPVSKPLSIAQSLGDDDEESIADSIADSAFSVAGGKINRSVKDRQEYFTNQSDCAAFGPHRALCSRCKEFVTLNRTQTYAVGPWERHRIKCDQELVSDKALPDDAEAQVNLPVAKLFRDARVRRTASERRAYLLIDDDAEVVEEDKVKCRKCTKWVALKKAHPYDLNKWKAHRDRCSGDSSPSERTLSANRKLTIVNDPQVKAFDETSVECNKCGDKVSSTSGKEYDLTSWELHKQTDCILNAPKPIENKNTTPFPTTQPSSSVVSSDATLVATADSSSLNPGKRARESDEAQPVEEERPATRARTENYETPVKEPPTALGWFLLPFKSFVRGFKESLTHND